MFFDLFIGWNTRARECRNGGAVRFQGGSDIDAIKARQKLASFPFVFEKKTVSLRARPEHFYYMVGLLLQRLEWNSETTIYAGEFVQGAIKNRHFEFVARHRHPRRAKRDHLNSVARQRLQLHGLIIDLNRGDVFIRV